MSIFSEANQHPQSLENEAGGTPLPAAEDFDTLYTDWIGKLENHLADLGHRSDLNLDDADIRFSSSLRGCLPRFSMAGASITCPAALRRGKSLGR